MDETALVVLIPQAEALVADHRLRYDPPASLGVPAQYPFRSVLDDIAADLIAELAANISDVRRHVRCASAFPGEVIDLTPDPTEPFRLLTESAAASFPGLSALRGRGPDPVPRLTVADTVDKATATALEIAAHPDFRSQPAWSASQMIAQDSGGHWDVVRHWPLG